MYGLGLGLRGPVMERWAVVRGRDELLHWLCFTHINGDMAGDPDETTWCGQTFFYREPRLEDSRPVTCLLCVGRPED